MSVYKMSFALALFAFLAGCGGGGGGGGTSNGGTGSSGPPDTTVPTVTTVSPGEDTSGTGTNSKLTATLSEAMLPSLITAIDPATGNPANFRLHDGTTYISGTVTLDTTNHIAVFTPTNALTPNKRYTATIITGIKDLGNNPLTTDFAWCFVTGGTDVTAPSVTTRTPASADTGVPINRAIGATFSEDMDTSTITSTNFTLTGPLAAPVSGNVTYRGRTAIFTPTQNLVSNTAYTATITTGVKDLANNASSANVAWSFTTGANADATAPFVDSFSPANSASNVPISATISIRLSEPMDPVTISTANFAVTGPGTALVIGTVAYNATNNTATFTRINHLTSPTDEVGHLTPVSLLDAGTTYIATLTTGARDMAGNALATDFVWSFTTQ